jgi:pimeloyl-ACP methyl ester carboxylesterase
VTLQTKLVAAAVLLVLTALVAAGLYVWKRPLSLYAWINRRALARGGFVKTEVATSVGRQTVWQAGSGKTLVVLHGAGDHAGGWADVAPRLATTHHVVVLDLAGHGESEPVKGPLSVGTVLTGVEEVVGGLTGGPVILVGNSLGAWIGLHYALRHPERVERLVLVNGGGLKGDRPDLTLTPSTREEAARTLAALRDPASPPISGWVMDDIIREAHVGPLGRLAQTAGEMDRYLLDGRLRKIVTPVDMVRGQSDRLFPPAYAQKMMAQLPASRLTLIPGCGHAPQQECPTRFLAVLREVLALPAPGPAIVTAGG